jgi:predicted phage terminase large subunit-like protein
VGRLPSGSSELPDPAWVIANAQKHKPTKILIEDASTGSALIQELRFTSHSGIGVKPTNDKITRMQIAAAKFESGKVFFPRTAPWLADLEAELFSFPQSRHDDQVDSISQALNETVLSYDPGAIAEGLSRILFSMPNWHVAF